VKHTIFISYRRSIASGSAGRLYDTISARFGEENVFMDVDAIGPGEDFEVVLQQSLRECRAVVVVIGPGWLTTQTKEGLRRLDNPRDYVRLEIEQALSTQVRLFPVLVDGALMPNPEELPQSLQGLVRSQAIEISSSRYRYDVGRLLAALEALQPAGAADGVPAPPLKVRPGFFDLSGLRKRVLLLALAVAAVIGPLVFWSMQGVTSLRWSSLEGMPHALEGAGVTSYQGRLWVAGGVSGEEGRSLLDRVSIFDPSTGSWSAGPTLPRPVAFAPLVLTDKYLYIIGGQSSSGAIANVLRLDNESGQWLEDVPLPEPRETGAAAWDGSRIVYAGGVKQDHAVSGDVFALEGGVWQTIGRLQIAREKATATTDGFGTTWIIGGRDRNSGIPAYGAVDVVLPDKIVPGSAVEPIHSSSALWLPNAGPCTVGGDEGERTTADIRCLRGDPRLPPLPVARAGIGSAVLGSDVYIVGGYDAGGHGSTDLQRLRLGT
jgi:TIR domain/Kelch motif